MLEQSSACPQCKKPSTSPSNRLVLDTCGHQKCRSCILDDAEVCKQCSEHSISISESNHTNDISSDQCEVLSTTVQCNGDSTTLPNGITKNDNVTDDREIVEDPVDEPKSAPKKRTIDIPKHIVVNSSPLSYLCTICNKSFTTKCHINYHKYCSGEVKPHKCQICQREFVLKAQLQIHMCKHNNIKPFRCTVCSKSFLEKNKLTRHAALHSARKNCICSICAKSFKTKESLRVHSLIHKSVKPFACKLCEAKFNNSSNLKKHVITHSDEKQHMCDQCGKRFKLKSALQVHRRSHSNVRPHECETCSKSFINSKELQRHLLTHAEIKGYTCGICMTSFRRKDNLHRHMKNTHPGKEGDIIKNPVKVSDLQKKTVVIDNPNAVNVITASPALTKCKTADTAQVALPLQRQPPTPISTDSRPTGSVINGPIKLAFKTPAFKSNYNITRGGDFVSSSQIAQDVVVPVASTSSMASSLSSFPAPAPVPIKGAPLFPTSNAFHYETSFQHKKHGVIKNIKFKVPEFYTHSFKMAQNSANVTGNINNNNKNENSDGAPSDNGSESERLDTLTERSVIVNNPSDVHWRRRTSQNLVLKN